jgi:hypothetical protein
LLCEQLLFKRPSQASHSCEQLLFKRPSQASHSSAVHDTDADFHNALPTWFTSCAFVYLPIPIPDTNRLVGVV